MQNLKVCFTGVGSIARRHIRNLSEICDKRGVELSIDAFRRKPGTDNSMGFDHVYCDIESVPSDYDVIFITNPTSMHLETLSKFHEKGKHFFIEKPVVSIDQTEEAAGFQIREESVYYIACPLRYNAVIQYLKNNVAFDDVISIRSISSSYLPDWRPGTDYRDTYSAHKEMGGGVSIDLIHEWDYITYLFGLPENVKSFSGKKSKLEIDSDDYAIYIAEYKDKIAELHLDYFGRKTIRELQLFTNNETIIGDIVNNTVHYLCSGNTIRFDEARDDFQKRELNHFLDLIYGEKDMSAGFTNALRILDLTQGIIN
jgi:predicted dehydrogenase